MRPGAEVVARPHGSEALRAGVEGSSEDEGALGDLLALDKALSGHVLLKERRLVPKREPLEITAYVDHAANVVDVAVLPTTVVDSILLHGDLGAVEDGGLGQPRVSREPASSSSSLCSPRSCRSRQIGSWLSPVDEEPESASWAVVSGKGEGKGSP